MLVQVMVFDGPRSDAHVAASQRAGRERIAPLVDAHPGLRGRVHGGFRATSPDGGELLVVLADDEAALGELGRLVLSSELLPGEDVTLLTGPDRTTTYGDLEGFGPLTAALAAVTTPQVVAR